MQDTAPGRVTHSKGKETLGKWRRLIHRPDSEPVSGVTVDARRAGNISYWPRGLCRQVLKPRVSREDSSGKTAAADSGSPTVRTTDKKMTSHS